MPDMDGGYMEAHPGMTHSEADANYGSGQSGVLRPV